MRNFDKTYLQMAMIWGQNSYAVRNKVGALIVKDGMIISDGFNGTPAGFDNDCEYVITNCDDNKRCLKKPFVCNKIKSPSLCYGCEQCERLTTKPYVLHAEANAITKLAKSGNSSDGATLYVTLSPCIECAKLIIQAGIVRVVYKDEYDKGDGITLLQRAGITVEQISIDESIE